MIADIAFILHWPLSELDDLTIGELRHWHALAEERYQAHHGKGVDQ
ncbi:MAG: GpE family phage tail protein [Pseudomonadota bacterium]